MEQLRTFFESGNHLAVLVGPSGCGKSHAVETVARERHLDIVWMSACQNFGADFAVQVAETRTVFSKHNKILVYEEFESLSPSDVVNIGKLPSTIFVALLAHSLRGRASKNFPKAAVIIEFPRPSDDCVLGILKNTFENASPSSLREIVASSRGDIRVALNAMRSGFVERDMDAEVGLDLAETIFSGSFPEGCELPDPTAIGAVQENYVSVCGVEACREIADALSLGDLLDVSPDGDALPEAHEIPLRTTALLCSERVKCEKFGRVWSHASTAAAKHTTYRKVRESQILTRLEVIDLAWVRTMILSLAERKDYAAAAALARGAKLTPQTLLWTMRLFKGTYTLTTHGHIKKHL